MAIIALVDCNNFFASRERVFNPSLEKKPIVVLSSNDGCIIARSNEAKQLGIPMGAPYYQWQALCQKSSVHVFSSNFELYSDFSSRIMTLLESLCPDIEIYSIDEAFLFLDTHSEAEAIQYAQQLREDIRSWTGIPISIGLAATKTLAKMANDIAKKHSQDGIYSLLEKQQREQTLATFPIADIWGIGKNLQAKLEAYNIKTARDLCVLNAKILRQQFSVVMERLVHELQGISCLPLSSIHQQKQMMYSRSFGKDITSLDEMEEALSFYAAQVCIRLRQHACMASGISVFLHTPLFSKKTPYYSNSISTYLDAPTADTRKIIQAAKKCLKTIFKPGFSYHKTGLILLDLLPLSHQQRDFFSPPADAKGVTLMKMMDHMTARWGRKALFCCGEGIEHEWQIKPQRRSPRYTTRWDELVEVK